MTKKVKKMAIGGKGSAKTQPPAPAGGKGGAKVAPPPPAKAATSNSLQDIAKNAQSKIGTQVATGTDSQSGKTQQNLLDEMKNAQSKIGTQAPAGAPASKEQQAGGGKGGAKTAPSPAPRGGKGSAKTAPAPAGGGKGGPAKKPGMKKGGSVKASKMGSVKKATPAMGSASSRGDGIAVRGKTKGKVC